MIAMSPVEAANELHPSLFSKSCVGYEYVEGRSGTVYAPEPKRVDSVCRIGFDSYLCIYDFSVPPVS